MDNQRSHKLWNQLYQSTHRRKEEKIKQNYFLKQEINLNLQITQAKIKFNKEKHEWPIKWQTIKEDKTSLIILSQKIGCY